MSKDNVSIRLFFAAIMLILLVATCLLVIFYPGKPSAADAGEADRETLLLWHNQALEAVIARDFYVAENKARQILHSVPDDLLAHKVMIMVLFHRRKFAEAVAICNKITDGIAIDLEVLNNFGVLLWLLGDRAGAERELRRAVNLAPTHPVINANLMAIKSLPAREKRQLLHGNERERHHLMLVIAPQSGEKGDTK